MGSNINKSLWIVHYLKQIEWGTISEWLKHGDLVVVVKYRRSNSVEG